MHFFIMTEREFLINKDRIVRIKILIPLAMNLEVFLRNYQYIRARTLLFKHKNIIK
jgi:hypothetical protein